MNTVTISKNEYVKLKKHSSAYLKIMKNTTDADQEPVYDPKYIRDLMTEARSLHKSGKTIEAGSIDEALKKFRKK